VVVPPLLGQLRVGYNLQSIDALLHLVGHPRLGARYEQERRSRFFSLAVSLAVSFL
jgi:hypothetical protein